MYLRELGVYEKVDERAAVAKYNVTPVDTDKAFEGEPVHIRSRMVSREFKSGDRPDLYAGTPPRALKDTMSIAASHGPEFSLMHVDASRAYFHAKAQRPVLVKLPAEGCSGKDAGNIGLLKKSMHGSRDAASDRERDWLARASRKLGIRAGAQLKKSVLQQEKENLGFDTRRRRCGGRNEGEPVGAQEATGERVSNQASSGQVRQRVSKR